MLSFCVNGCRISIHFLFIAAVTFLILCDTQGTVLAGVTAAALHESAHLTAMFLLKVPPKQVRLHPFGIDIVRSDGVDHSYGKDAIISVCGPAMNLAIAGIFFFIHNQVFTRFMLANVVLGVFNFLPVETLDGGQALYAGLCIRLKTERAALCVRILSFLTLIPLAAMGFLILFQSRYNFTLLLVTIYLTILLVVKKGYSL